MGWFTDLFISKETKRNRKEIEEIKRRNDELEKEVNRLIVQSKIILKLDELEDVSKGD